MTYPHPVHHATMLMPVEDMPSGWTARVLFLRKPDGRVEIYEPLLAYMREHPAKSGTWQDEIARALGLLWDFIQSRGEALNFQSLRERAFLQQLFRAFALNLVTGTIEAGCDPSGLHWPSVPLSVAKKAVRRIEDFSRWCHAEFFCQLTNTDPIQIREDSLNFTDVLIWSRIRNVTMLKHLSVQPRIVRRRSIVDFGPHARGHSTEPVKAFPRTHAERLIWEGHRRPKSVDTTDPCKIYNVRDQMMALLDGWGGLRRSEGLHLWVGDVVENPEKPGHAVVTLHHPSEAEVLYYDPITLKATRGTRTQALEKLYGLLPRNIVKRGRYHVGWKGMDLDQRYSSIVYWLDDSASALFWILYLIYLNFVRKPIIARRQLLGGKDHPFLFVSEGTDRKADAKSLLGDPYSAQAYERNHEAAVLRLKLPYGKEHGTTTHGLRHMYGQSLSDLRLSPGVIR